MTGPFHHCLKRLAANERGAGVLELALVAPILCFVILGVIDLSMGFSARMSLEQAAYRTLERVTVGARQTDYGYLRAEAAIAANVPESNVTVDAWLECDTQRNSSFSGTCSTEQTTARYVQVSIHSSYQPAFNYGPLGRAVALDADGNVPLVAVAAVRIQ